MDTNNNWKKFKTLWNWRVYYKSRLLILDDANVYTGKDFYFKYNLKPFSSKNRNIKKEEGKWITSIDGKKPWGTDGGFPKIQIESIDVKINDEEILIEKQYFQNLFEISDTFKVIKSGEYFIVYQSNSDGAGGYDLAWVFDENELKQILVGTKI